MSLVEVEQQLQAQGTKREQELALLQVLAVMVETLHHSVLLRKITQVSLLFHKLKVLAASKKDFLSAHRSRREIKPP